MSPARASVSAGATVLVVAVVVSTGLGYTEDRRLAAVGNGVLVLGLVGAFVLFLTGLVLRLVLGKRRRRRR